MAHSPWRSSLALMLLPALAAAAPSFEEVKARQSISEGRLFARGGELLQERRVQLRGRNLGWAPLSEISPALVEAVQRVEDRHFSEHGGVDYRAVAAAAWDSLRGQRRGASTITMQTVNYLDEQLGANRGPRRGLWHKIRQARLAWELEAAWNKEQILETYLNLVSFRGEFQGVLAASRALFGKDPHGLDRKESYLLAALLRSPGAKSSTVASRICLVAPPEAGSCEELQAFALATLSRPPVNRDRAELAPHLARRLLAPGRQAVHTTIHAGLQRELMAAIEDQVKSLRAQNVRDAAAIAVENRTGRVLAYVGSSGKWSESPQVDMVQSKRQAGSTLKPFLYELAFESKLLRPGSWLLDEPFELSLGRGSYRPENYDHGFQGAVPVSVALASSLNVPAVRVIDLVGEEAFREKLAEIGFRDLEEAEFYGPSLALGSADVSLFDLTAAYAALANEGKRVELTFEPGVASKARRVMEAGSAREILAILSSRDARAPTFGWDSALSPPYPAAVKTGTSKDMRDNWCIGSTADFTVGVWLGNSGGDPMWQVSGVDGAAPIWRRGMDFLQKNRRPRALPVLAEAPEKFQKARFGRILYPSDGEIIALDGDIPVDRQRVPLESDVPGIFQVDGIVAEGGSWKPERGRHVVSLHSNGKKLHELKIEVR